MNYKPISKLSPNFLLSIALIALPLLLFGCSSGSDGAPGTSSGTLTGSVIDTFNNKVANATVTPAPAVDSLPGGRVTTAADGTYSMTLPAGSYTLTFANAAYVTQTLSVSVVATQTKQNATITLVPVKAAAVTVTGPTTFPATGPVTLTAALVPLDPALVGKAVTFQWKDQRGTVLGTGASVAINRPTAAEFKANVANMVSGLFAFEEDPRNTPDEEGEEGVHFKDIRIFKTLDRLMVVGIPMKAFEDAANPTYTITATVNGQTFSQTVAVGAGTSGLPFVANPGLRNVPIGQPLMLQGPDSTGTQTTWNFTLTKPAGSAAALDLIDKTTRFPHFTPDVVGTYTVAETVSGKSMEVYAGKWVGILKPAFDGSDNPRGDVDPGCLLGSICHSTATQAKFTEWRRSGHSEVMVVGMAEGSHYNLNSCANCHSVGGTYLGADTSAGSFRNVIAAAGFTNATFLGKLIPSLDEAVKEKSKFFQGFPQVLQLSEVQCENCHGPNSNGDVHGPSRPDAADAKAARVSFSSDVCAPCHGEPRRHGRYQEWRESGHGEFQLAIDEGVAASGVGPNTSCAGCHAGQAFPLWLAQLQGGNPLRTLNAASIAALSFLREDNVQPITCVTCHTPHDAGRQPGLVGNVVKLRGDYQTGGAFDGNTPLLPAGFQANGVGRGALCITCHNSRNGGSGTTVALHEDGDPIFGNPTATSYSSMVPHAACQGDVLMGRNAYFFGSGQIGQRSKHSLLADACVTCHLQKTPADPAFGVSPTTDGAGTNHSFGIITDPALTVETQVNNLCKQCHGDFEGTGVQKTFTAALDNLLAEMGKAILRVKFGSAAAIPPGTTLVFTPGRTPTVIVNGGTPVNLATYIANAPGTPVTGPIPASGFNIAIAKVNWNLELVEADASKGVHNPGFTLDVIAATLNFVKGM